MSLEFEVIRPDAQSVAHGLFMSAFAFQLCHAVDFKQRLSTVPYAYVDLEASHLVLEADAFDVKGRQVSATARYPLPDHATSEVLRELEVFCELWNLHAGHG